MESVLAESYRDRTFTLGILAALALLSLFLSAAGIYGVVSYTVSARSREIGIRLALGAQLWKLRARILLLSGRAVAAGTFLGVLLALAAGGLLRSLLYGVAPRDPAVLIVSLLVLWIAAPVAIMVPAVQQTRVDPTRALRAE